MKSVKSKKRKNPKIPSKEQFNELGEKLDIAPNSFAYRREIRDLVYLHRKNGVIVSKLFRYKNRRIILHNVFRLYGVRRSKREEERWRVYELKKKNTTNKHRLLRKLKHEQELQEDSNSDSEDSVDMANSEDLRTALREKLNDLKCKPAVPLFEKKTVESLAQTPAPNIPTKATEIIPEKEAVPEQPIPENSDTVSETNKNVSLVGAIATNERIINTLFNRFDCNKSDQKSSAVDAQEQSTSFEESSDECFEGFNENIPAGKESSLDENIGENRSFSIFGHKASPSRRSMPKRSDTSIQPSEGLVSIDSTPPALQVPLRHMDVDKPRTLAEKRAKLQQTASLNYLMIENEATISRELRRKQQTHSRRKSAIKNVFDQTTPMRKECLRAASWANTDVGRYFLQKARFDTCTVNVFVAEGNHIKPIQETFPDPPRQSLIKSKKTPVNRNASTTSVATFSDVKYKLNVPARVAPKDCLVKSKKLSHKRFSEDVYFESGLMPYKMPLVNLCLYPKVGRPLPEYSISSLGIHVPDDCGLISKEWATFSVATTVSTNGQTEQNIEQFSFPMNYKNGDTVLVRKKRVFNLTAIESNILEDSLTKPISLNDNDDECAKMLLDCINAVAIGLEGDCLIKDDPDYIESCDAQDSNSFRQSAPDGKTDTDLNSIINIKNRRTLKELKRLNTNSIILPEIPQKPKICNDEICRLGCVCSSIACDANLKMSLEQIKSASNHHLAKEEKDFAPTIVVKSDNTIVVKNQRDGLKRTKAVPKRFRDDYALEHPGQSTTTSINNVEHDIEATNINAMYNMKQCSVNVANLEFVTKMRPFCLYHQLYKCFCAPDGTSGQPFILTGDVSDDAASLLKTPARRPMYTYDTTETSESNTVTETTAGKRNRGRPRKINSSDSAKDATIKVTESLGLRPRRSRTNFDEDSCINSMASSNTSKVEHTAYGTEVIEDRNKDRNKHLSAQSEPKDVCLENSLHSPDYLLNSIFERQAQERLKFVFENIKAKEWAISRSCDPAQALVMVENTSSFLETTIIKLSDAQRAMAGVIKAPTTNVLNCVSFENLINNYKTKQVEIWLGTFQGQQTLYVTEKNDKPRLTKKSRIQRIHEVPYHILPLAATLIRKRLVSRKSDVQMCVLFLGQSNYWIFSGFVVSPKNYLKVGLDVDAPIEENVKNKIRNLQYLIACRQKAQVNQKSCSDDVVIVDEYINNTELSVPKNKPIKPSPSQMTQAQMLTATLVQQKYSDNIALFDVSTTVKFMKTFPLPPMINKKRYFVLELGTDFSHIYVKSWDRYLCYTYIQEAFKKVQIDKQTRNIRPLQANALPDVFIVAHTKQVLFFGPYDYDEPHLLSLCQEYNGTIMLREKFDELKKNSSDITRPVKSKGCWIYSNSDRVQNPTGSSASNKPMSLLKRQMSQNGTNSDEKRIKLGHELKTDQNIPYIVMNKSQPLKIIIKNSNLPIDSEQNGQEDANEPMHAKIAISTARKHVPQPEKVVNFAVLPNNQGQTLSFAKSEAPVLSSAAGSQGISSVCRKNSLAEAPNPHYTLSDTQVQNLHSFAPTDALTLTSAVIGQRRPSVLDKTSANNVPMPILDNLANNNLLQQNIVGNKVLQPGIKSAAVVRRRSSIAPQSGNKPMNMDEDELIRTIFLPTSAPISHRNISFVKPIAQADQDNKSKQRFEAEIPTAAKFATPEALLKPLNVQRTSHVKQKEQNTPKTKSLQPIRPKPAAPACAATVTGRRYSVSSALQTNESTNQMPSFITTNLIITPVKEDQNATQISGLPGNKITRRRQTLIDNPSTNSCFQDLRISSVVSLNKDSAFAVGTNALSTTQSASGMTTVGKPSNLKRTYSTIAMPTRSATTTSTAQSASAKKIASNPSILKRTYSTIAMPTNSATSTSTTQSASVKKTAANHSNLKRTYSTIAMPTSSANFRVSRCNTTHNEDPIDLCSDDEDAIKIPNLPTMLMSNGNTQRFSKQPPSSATNHRSKANNPARSGFLMSNVNGLGCITATYSPNGYLFHLLNAQSICLKSINAVTKYLTNYVDRIILKNLTPDVPIYWQFHTMQSFNVKTEKFILFDRSNLSKKMIIINNVLYDLSKISIEKDISEKYRLEVYNLKESLVESGKLDPLKIETIIVDD